MITKISKLDSKNIDENIIKKASDLIKNGELVAFPTETVYGLGADGLNENACKKIFEAKGRPSDNPLILHISNISMLYNLVENVDPKSKKLIDKCWPGPLTIIFKKSKIIPNIITAGLDTVAIRFPSNKIAQNLIEASNTPIAAPSANISGRPSPTRADDVYNDMNGKINLILDGGESDIGIESTVIDMSEDIPTILRPGFFTFEFIKEILSDVKLDDSLVDNSKIPKSPGQKYKHYAPKAKMEVYLGEKSEEAIKTKALELEEKGLKVGVLVFDQYKNDFKDYFLISLGDKADLSYMSHVLFTSLRLMDMENVDVILAQGVEEINLGKSIMNRMKKSASGNVIYL
ncbi:L-threonylcarbamoyladenylate synthase [Anaerococcus sp. Marseille-P9784]|uniref:L-threonylcarbamoyladenylate synthase n=1 Tax=Anaerococcus sp. Marseille-P9784 TaxID=2614127 RepID=UPI00124A953A|nr:L-threonylcarbamoyladenylate synthase [Anaerococcus sp. Marseille-P9784]